jgi:hypothetical protein
MQYSNKMVQNIKYGKLICQKKSTDESLSLMEKIMIFHDYSMKIYGHNES